MDALVGSKTKLVASWLLKRVAMLRSTGYVGTKFVITEALTSLLFKASF
jgi:hypothetical protein